MAKGTLNITSDGIGSADITDDSIAAADIAADAVTTSELAAGAVTTENVLDTTIVTLTCGTTNTSTTVTAASTTGMIVGAAVSGAGVPALATVISIITNTSFVLSAAATATASVTLTFDSGITSNKLAQNLTLTGDYVKIPTATTTQRDALTGAVGMLIYNSTLGLLQQYNAAGWGSIAAPPAFTSLTYPTDEGAVTTALDAGSGAGTQTLLINGSGFSATVTVEVEVSGTFTALAGSTSVNGSKTIITCSNVTLRAAADGYSLRITNTSSLSVLTTVNFSADPGWTTAAALGTVYTGGTLNKSLVMSGDGTLVATNGTPNKPTWMTVAGGASTADNGAGDTTFNATGTPLTLAGTIANSGLTETFTFGIIVRDSQNQTLERDFVLIAEDPSTVTGGGSIVTYTDTSDSLAYRAHIFTSTGNLVLPIAKTVQFFMIGGGGAGGAHHGGGGAGGVAIVDTSHAFAAGTYVCTVGGGGASVFGSTPGTSGTVGTSGTTSTIAGAGLESSTTIYATHGSGGGHYNNVAGASGAGGGGGGGYNGAAGTGSVSYGSTTQSSGSLTTYGGYNGAARSGGTGPGGGGAGSSANASQYRGGAGVSNYYRDGNHSGTTAGTHKFGGGGGCGNDNNPYDTSGNGTSTGDGTYGYNLYGGGTGVYGNGNTPTTNPYTNSGGGGAGSSGGGPFASMGGADGIIIVRYLT